jgi:hypothetical protein
MNSPRFLKCAGAVVALAFVSACAGGSTVAPSPATVTTSAKLRATYVGKTLFVNGRPVTAARLNPLPRYAELVPDGSKSTTYEYIFNDYGSYGSIFNYPTSNNMIGQLDGAGGQGCTNKLQGYGKKIVWNAGRTNNVITEYSVPDNKVLETLPLNYNFTSSCAMNKNGDLAVGVLLSDSYGSAGQQVVFKNATGKGTVYNTPLSKAYFAGYDPKGNLFADGEDQNYNFMLVELPNGSSKAVTITTSNTPEFPGSVQWDGKYVTVFDQLTNQIYQYTISGTEATLKNTIQFSGSSDCAQTWIVPGLLYCGDAGNDEGYVFKYPAGGSPLATFSGSFDFPLGVTAAKE